MPAPGQLAPHRDNAHFAKMLEALQSKDEPNLAREVAELRMENAQLLAALEATSNAEQTKEEAGHRLALELECLLLDCKDNAVVSRWMDTACEALDAWRRLFPYLGPRLGD